MKRQAAEGEFLSNLDDAEAFAMAKSFGLPVLLNADIRLGTLRQAADLGVK